VSTSDHAAEITGRAPRASVRQVTGRSATPGKQTTLATLPVLTVGYFLAYAPFDRLRERFAGGATGTLHTMALLSSVGCHA